MPSTSAVVAAASELATLNPPPRPTVTPPVAPRVGVAVGADLDVVDIRRREGHHLDARCVGQQAAVWIVDVGHADRSHLRREQAGLGAEVVLHRPVQVEVVGTEVGEHRGGEPRAVDAMHRHGMR